MYELPIIENNEKTRVKTINHVTLPNFHVQTTKDPNTLFLEFEVVCGTYDYLVDAQNLKIFPLTLKDIDFRWFMSL